MTRQSKWLIAVGIFGYLIWRDNFKRWMNGGAFIDNPSITKKD